MPKSASFKKSEMIGLVLLVEDNPSVLAARQAFFRESGLPAIGVSTKDEAIRQVKNTPGITLVATDVDLSGGGANIPNWDGVDLANDIRKIRASMPIVAYTAHEEEFFLDSLDAGVFDRFFPKSSDVAQLSVIVQDCIQLASTYKKEQSEEAKLELVRLQEKYDIPDYDVSTLRSLLPGTGANQMTAPTNADDLLRQSGYSLRLVEAGRAVEDDDGQAVATLAPIWIWIKQEGVDVIAEMHGHPSIYAAGASEAEVVTSLVQLLRGYYLDLKEPSNKPIGGEISALKNSLHHIFG